MNEPAVYLTEIELALIHSPVIADYQIVRAAQFSASYPSRR